MAIKIQIMTDLLNKEYYINRCLELAARGGRRVRPNPHVGCVIVHNGEIIGEGYHEYYGGNHAEVNAINSVRDKNLLKESTLYVTLEPCSHWGKTPPCADLIIRCGIPHVVVGMIDPFVQVAGRGIAKLREAGIKVECGVLEDKCKELNKDFIVYHTLKRPYTILKWAETADGFIDNDRPATEPAPWITGEKCRELVHSWRAECDAIMVGTNTIERDNPRLTVRNVEGQNPLRVVIDRTLRLSPNANVFDSEANTLIFTTRENMSKCAELHPECEVETIDFGENMLDEMMKKLYDRKITTLFVEGGTTLINNLIARNLWDEARVFHSKLRVCELAGGSGSEQGVRAPKLNLDAIEQLNIDGTALEFFKNDTIK